MILSFLLYFNINSLISLPQTTGDHLLACVMAGDHLLAVVMGKLYLPGSMIDRQSSRQKISLSCGRVKKQPGAVPRPRFASPVPANKLFK
jgi:hypothetical protein